MLSQTSQNDAKQNTEIIANHRKSKLGTAKQSKSYQSNMQIHVHRRETTRKTKQCKAKQCNAKRHETKHSKTKQFKAKRSKAKQGNTKQHKAKQNKAKHNTATPCRTIRRKATPNYQHGKSNQMQTN